MAETTQTVIVGRYVIGNVIASGGMASVHLGRLTAAEHGFARTVAIKRLHPHLGRDPEFVKGFLDEARLASRIRHANVVSVLDIVSLENELFLVMEYVEGVGLNVLLRSARKAEVVPPRNIAIRVILDLLEGLHAAHEATDDDGAALGIIHRDVSPQNVLIGTDGVARIVDFGVAKAIGQLHETRSSEVKGKLSYMAPEQLYGVNVTRSVDVYAASIILWEALTGHRLFAAASDGELVHRVTSQLIEPPSKVASGISPMLDAVVMRGLARDPTTRYLTAAAMAEALEQVSAPAPRRVVAQWVKERDEGQLALRAELVSTFERMRNVSSGRLPIPPASAAHLAGAPGLGGGGEETIPIDVTSTEISSPSHASASVPGVAREPTTTATEQIRRRGSRRRPLIMLSGLAVIGIGLGGAALMVRSQRASTTPAAAATTITKAPSSPTSMALTASSTSSVGAEPSSPSVSSTAAAGTVVGGTAASSSTNTNATAPSTSSSSASPRTVVGGAATPNVRRGSGPALGATKPLAGAKPSASVPVSLYSRD